jgi:hypothetical protein
MQTHRIRKLTANTLAIKTANLQVRPKTSLEKIKNRRMHIVLLKRCNCNFRQINDYFIKALNCSLLLAGSRLGSCLSVWLTLGGRQRVLRSYLRSTTWLYYWSRANNWASFNHRATSNNRLSLCRRRLRRFLGLIGFHCSYVYYNRWSDHEGRLWAITRVCSHLEAKNEICLIFYFELVWEA